MTTKILIAEDEGAIRAELVECLTEEGYECVEAANGHQGTDLLRRDKEISIVLSDILMPGKSGLEMINTTLAEIDKDRHLEFIILTGHGGVNEAIDALRLGVMDFLVKPVDLERLVHVVRRAEELVLLKRVSSRYEAKLEAEVQAQTHELETRQIELELQNKELRESKIEIMKMRDLQLTKLNATLDSIEEPVYIFDIDTLEYSYVNKAARKFSGLKEEDYIGHTPKELFDGFDIQEFKARYSGLYTGEIKAITYETEHLGHKGELVPVEILAQIIRTEGEPSHFIEIVRDISQRRAIDKAKSEFISTISHELRTPLTSIKGVLGLINADAFHAAPEKLRPMAKIAYDNSNRLELLINDILDIEKIAAGGMEFHLNPMSANKLILGAVEATEEYGHKYGVEFSCEFGDEPMVIDADKNRLMQVMANLLSNAAKFSSNSSKVVVSTTRKNGNIRISVQDYGDGIPVVAQATIFDRFTQANSSDQRSKGGTGLGLNISKVLVEGHGGTLDFVSEIGVGSTFYFDLPSKPENKG
jgi:PAS domain S-box-containing protein